MKKFTVVAILAILAIAALFSACSAPNPEIVCGREWNPGSQVVADTSSEFDMTDQLIVQFRYGTGFDFSKLKLAFYEGTLSNKGKEIWNHEVSVSSKMESYTLQGKSKHGGLMTAREMTRRKKPGTVVIEVTTGDRLLAAKEISIVKNK